MTSAVLVKLVPDNGGAKVEFSATRPGVRPLTLTIVDTGAIAAARRQLRRGLTELKDLVPGLDVDDSELTGVLEKMASTGRRMMRTLFGGSPSVVRAQQEFWRSAIPAWRNETLPIVVECVGHKDHMLPLEYLPVFDVEGCDRPVSSRADFYRQCRSFLGFAGVVRRRLMDVSVPANNWLVPGADGRLRLRYLWHEELPGAHDELRWLNGAGAKRVRVLGPYPTGHETTADIAEQIFIKQWDIHHERTDQIQHFSCHCYAGETVDPDDYELTLCGHRRELRMTLGDLGDLQVKYAYLSHYPPGSMPFVLLNACGSSTVDPTSSLSFPELFLANENRGVLGTEVAVRDGLAARFSQEFYRALLLRGATVGDAARHARTQLLRAHRNPLGLAYVIYGNTELKVL